MFQLERDAAAPRLELRGSLTIYEVNDARTLLLEALGSAPVQEWQMGLAQLDELDTAGVQLLLSARHFLHAAGGSLRLVEAGAGVLELLDLLHVAQADARAQC